MNLDPVKYTNEKINHVMQLAEMAIGKNHDRWPDLRKCLLDDLNDLKRLIQGLTQKKGERYEYTEHA